MKINWKVLDPMLIGEAESDDVSTQCKEEIYEFVQTHNFEVFSEESLEELAGIFRLSIQPAYEHITKTKIPNIFHSIRLEKSEEEPEEEEGNNDEQESLSERFF